MAITHTNRRGQVYNLHIGTKRGGGKQYYFTTDPSGELADHLPAGFEIYESIHGQVFLRRQKPKLIRDDEVAVIQDPLQRLRGPHRYVAEARGDTITVYEGTSSGASLLLEFAPRTSKQDVEAYSAKHAYYQAVLRFVLVDDKDRIFAPERFCFRGSVDGWISIGNPDSVKKLAATFLKHLGKESMFDLY